MKMVEKMSRKLNIENGGRENFFGLWNSHGTDGEKGERKVINKKSLFRCTEAWHIAPRHAPGERSPSSPNLPEQATPNQDTSNRGSMKGRDREKDLWARIMEDVRRRGDVGAFGVESLLSKLSLREDTGTKLLVEYPEGLHVTWVEINYTDHLTLSAAHVLGAARSIEFVPAEPPAKEALLPLDFPAEEPAAASLSEQVEPTPAPKRKRVRSVASFNSGLNEDYTFDNFVVGSNNEFAHAAAKALTTTPGHLYNPLFIHGASGLGKTHLLHAIGNALRSRNEDIRVLYVTSEEFTNGYIDAIACKGWSSFRNKYRQADVLLIDDIQFLAKKEKAQEEFFHTFNKLLSSGKQIVLSADCAAADVTGLDDRLTSRFEQGLSVALSPPAYETRLAILRNKRRQWKSELIGDDVLDFLAKSITRDVRRLEGALTCLASIASFSNQQPTINEARMQLKGYLNEEPVLRLSIKNIQQCVADEFNLRVTDLNGKRRTAAIAHPRQIAMFLARHHTGSSLQDIGAAFGGRNHATVIHATRTIEQKIQEDADLRITLNRLLSTLGAPASSMVSA